MYKNETEVMKKLKINKWNQLSKDKMLNFVAMMPDIDNEVRLKILDNLPEFKELALTIVKEIDETHRKIIDSNEINQKYIHEAYSETRQILQKQLDRDIVTPEERMHICNLLVKLLENEGELDKNNKKFLNNIAVAGAVLGGFALALLGVAICGKLSIVRGEGDIIDTDSINDET